MTSGAKVVLAMLGGTLAIALFVVAAFLLTDEGNLRCVANEDTLNPRDAEGRILPETRSYDNISDAEAFICHEIAYPRLEGWILESAAATRSSDLGKVIEGEATAAVLLSYRRADSGASDSGASLEIEVSPTEIQRGDFEGDQESIRVGDADATLIRSPEPGYPLRRVLWKAGGLDFMATAFLTNGFTESEFFAVLESVR